MSGPNYRLRNQNAIKRGFSHLATYANNTVRVVATNMAHDGLASLIEVHRLMIGGHDGHHFHLIEENTLGYAVAHDGVVVETGYHHGSGNEPLPGEAVEMAKIITEGTIGWRVVIISDLLWAHYDGHEEDMLNTARGVLSDKWNGINSIYLIPGAIPKPN